MDIFPGGNNLKIDDRALTSNLKEVEAQLRHSEPRKIVNVVSWVFMGRVFSQLKLDQLRPLGRNRATDQHLVLGALSGWFRSVGHSA